MTKIPAAVYDRKAAERNAALGLSKQAKLSGNAVLEQVMLARYKRLQGEIKAMFADPNAVIVGDISGANKK